MDEPFTYEEIRFLFWVCLFGLMILAGIADWLIEKKKKEGNQAVKPSTKKYFELERANWISLLEDRQNAIGDLVAENGKLKKEIEMLNQLLSESEALRLGK